MVEQEALPRSGVIAADAKLCHGCGICELACSLYHDGVCSPSISRMRLRRQPLEGEFLLETCRQCDHPECYFACPTGAVVIEPKTGARTVRGEDCTGCRVCYELCPFNGDGAVIRLSPLGNVYLKCDLCYDRAEGPVCVEACPWKALSYVPAEAR